MKEQQLEEARLSCEQIIDRVAETFVGNRLLLRKLLAAALANGHVLFEDYPGLGKTLLAKLFARSIGGDTKRVQFTPDLLPSDVLGVNIWRQNVGTFELMRGPVFTNVLLADEINRAPPKTQSALLEAMEERQVTIDGDTMPLGSPFVVIATQNPIEQEGTYPCRRRNSTASCSSCPPVIQPMTRWRRTSYCDESSGRRTTPPLNLNQRWE